MEISVKFKLNNTSVPHNTKRFTHKSLTLKTLITCQTNNNITLQQTPNFYKVLSLPSENVGFAEIKKAYRTMALKFHPDVSSNPSTKEENTRRFLELRDAYETLSDPVMRQKYDTALYLGEHSLGFGYTGIRRESSTSAVGRDVLEEQLNGLKKRSSDRMRRRRET